MAQGRKASLLPHDVNIGGSRCSRVNGRGWRCGQRMLVGYSLCEHHLGKGRLRCMSTSVRGRVAASRKGSKNPRPVQQPAGTDDAALLVSGLEEIKAFSDDNKVEEDDDDDEETMDSAEVIGKKRARSMSSLFRQGPEDADDSSVATAAHVVEGDLRS